MKPFLTFMAILIAGLIMINPAFAKGNPRYASMVIDADTGVIIHQRYADKSLHPASLTKMMTLMMLFEALDRGDIELKDRIYISKHAASMVPSKLDLPVGSSIRVEDAIYSLVTKSANDIAAAVAEYLGGTESKFASMMTKRAHDIGMSRTTFRNASGLHDPKQVSTARDMATLGRYILIRYPHYYKYFSTKQFTYRGKTYGNHNRLMNSYDGMDGFKTGYVAASGFNLVASAVRNNRRLIGVVFGGRTSQTRNAHMKDILDRGFEKVKDIRIAKAPVPERKPILASSTAPAANQAVASGGSNYNRNDKQDSFTSLSSLQTRKTRIAIKPSNENYTALTSALENGAFSELIGEGDYDPAVTKRLETGLLAVAVHKGEYKPNPAPAGPVEASFREAGHAVISRMGNDDKANKISPTAGQLDYRTASLANGRWSVQIGAYNSRAATDNALQSAVQKLPANLSNASPAAVPLRTAEGLIFRARLAGLSKSEALKACEHFRDCITIAPGAN